MKYQSAFAASILPLALALGACNPSADEAAVNNAVAAEAPIQLKAPAGVYALDPTHTSLQWSLLHMGLSNYTARFDDVQGEVTLDPADLSKSSVSVTVASASMNANFPDAMYKANFAKTGFASWSEDLAKSPMYLNASAFPTMTFKSTSVAPTGPRTADVTGDLTILGVTKPVTLKASFVGEMEKHPFLQQPAVGFSAEGSFKRTDFGIAKHLPTQAIGDDVTIRFEGEFIKKADAPAGAAG